MRSVESGKRILKAWIITPIAVVLLFVFWMFQGVVLKGDLMERAKKESYDNFFLDYYDNDEGITFDVLSTEKYKALPLSQDEVRVRGETYLAEKQVDIEQFAMIIDQGIYSNMGLGISEILAWRVMFVDIHEEKQAANEELADSNEQAVDTTDTVKTESDRAETDSNGVKTELESAEEIDTDAIEERLRYWIVLDGQTGEILSAYSNGK